LVDIDETQSIDATRESVNQAETPPADPSDIDQEKVFLAKGTLRHLDKVVKTLSLFGPDHINPKKAREEFYQKMTEFLEKYENLELDLDASKAFCDTALVMEGDGQKEDFIFRMFQDGVNKLIVSNGISTEELDSLVELLLTNFSSSTYLHDDMVTLLWDLNPKHIHFAISEAQ